MEYADQSASALRFYLRAGYVDVTELSIIRETSFAWNHQTIEMGILGASHFLRISSPDGKVLSEVFACTELDLPGSFIKSAPFDELAPKVEARHAGLCYRFSPRLVGWDDGKEELEILREAIASNDAANRMHGFEYQFPVLPGADLSKPPLTLMSAKVGGQFTLKTAHCYPNEEQIVFTTTTLSK